jgi:hypothetical protein
MMPKKRRSDVAPVRSDKSEIADSIFWKKFLEARGAASAIQTRNSSVTIISAHSYKNSSWWTSRELSISERRIGEREWHKKCGYRISDLRGVLGIAGMILGVGPGTG